MEYQLMIPTFEVKPFEDMDKNEAQTYCSSAHRYRVKKQIKFA
jgi:hypothetical protein